MNKSAKSEVVTPPPSLMKSLTAGFDAISTHAWLVVFTGLLDSLLWFGPRLRFYALVKDFLVRQSALATSANAELIEGVREMFMNFNLMSSLRTFPVGIPSLMVNRSPAQSPAGIPVIYEIDSFAPAILIWLLLNLVGTCGGALYFILVAQVTANGKVEWSKVAKNFPHAVIQVFLLTLAGVLGIFLLGLPFSCILSVMLLGGVGVANFTSIIALVAGGLVVWMLLPLVFSPHGIFVYQYKFWQSIKNSIRIARMTLPTTSLFILALVVINEGMSLLWSIPEETSWFSLIGILGHGFVSTSLLASTFIYFQDANRWVKDIIERTRLLAV